MSEIKLHKPLLKDGKFHNDYFDDELGKYGVVDLQDLTSLMDSEQEEYTYRLMDKVAHLALDEASQTARSLQPWVDHALGGASIGFQNMYYDPYQNQFFTGKNIETKKNATDDEHDACVDAFSHMHLDKKRKTALPDKKYPQIFKVVNCVPSPKALVQKYAIANFWNDTLMAVGFSLTYGEAEEARLDMADYFKPLPVHDNTLGLKGYLTIIGQ